MLRFADPARGSVPRSFDAIVIGSGIGSLTAALELSRQGLKVGVFEKRRNHGGYAASFRREGFHFDVSMHHIGGLAPGCLLHGYLSSLGILERLACTPCSDLFVSDYPGLSIRLSGRREEILQELSRIFPEESDGLVRLFDTMAKIKAGVVAPTLADVVHGEDSAASRIWNDKTYDELLRSFVRDDRLIAILSQMWLYIGLPPNLAAANFSACVNATAFLEGTWTVIGGGLTIVRAFIEAIREYGSDCYQAGEVVNINIANGRASGITLVDGTEIQAPVVISGINPVHTFFSLVPPGTVSDVYRYRLKQMVPSLSLYALYLGLKCAPSVLGIPDGDFFFNHQYACEESYVNLMEGHIDRTDYCVDNAGRKGTSVHPAGKGIVVFKELTPARDWLDLDQNAYREKKRAVRELLLEKYEKRFPGLRRNIAVEDFSTPRSFARMTDNPMGAVYGYAQLPNQSGTRRLQSRTPVDGLYLTGAWSGSGGGYEGAIASGLQTAGILMQVEGFPYRAPRVRLHTEQLQSAAAPLREEPREIRPAVAIDERVSMDSHYRYLFSLTVYGDEMNSRGYADASAYLRYMDRARMEAVEDICSRSGKESWLNDYIVQVYRIEARCATVVRLSDQLEVRTGIRRISTYRASFDQRIINRATGHVVVDAMVEVLFLNQNKILVPVPEELISTDDEAPDFSFDRTEPMPFKDEAHFPFRTQYRVYFEDTDLQAVMFHVSYLRFCERALFDLIRVTWPDMKPVEWMRKHRSNVARVDIRYLHAAHLGDYLEVRSGPLGITSEKLTFGQRIVNVRTGEVLADAVTDVEFRDQKEQIIEIPREIVDLTRSVLDVTP